jgi:hypothetical protein
VDLAAVTAKRMARFPGVAVMAELRGPNGGDGRADDMIPRGGGDCDDVGGDRGGDGVVPMVEEEQDDAVLWCGGEVWADGMDSAASKRVLEILAA